MQRERLIDVQRNRKRCRHVPREMTQQDSLVAQRDSGSLISRETGHQFLVENNHDVLHPIGDQARPVDDGHHARLNHSFDEAVDGGQIDGCRLCRIGSLGHQDRLTDKHSVVEPRRHAAQRLPHTTREAPDHSRRNVKRPGIRVCVGPLIFDTLENSMVDHRAERANPLELLI